ncbi:hypothetical protein ACVI8K_007366 [Bradyrhizobium barranii subsp. barranii]
MAAVPVTRVLFPARRPHGGPDAGGDCDPRADGHGAAWRFCAADRLLRVHGGLARFRTARRQPLPVLRRGFHDHADLRRRTCRARCHRLARISGACDRTGADGRRDDAGQRRFPPRRHRQSFVSAGHGRLPRRHFRPHHRVAIAGRARASVTERGRRSIASAYSRPNSATPTPSRSASGSVCSPWSSSPRGSARKFRVR